MDFANYKSDGLCLATLSFDGFEERGLLTSIENLMGKSILGTRRVMIVAGDHEICWLLEKALRQDASLIVVGYATDWGQILKISCELTPEVILLDLDHLPQNGLEAVLLLKKDRSSLAVLGIGGETFDGPPGLLDAYWPKRTVFEGLITAVKTVSSTTAE